MTGLSHPWSRFAGMLIAGAAVFFLDITKAGPVHQLWLPLTLALSAYLVTRALPAVAFAAFALAALSTNIGADDWIASSAYPAVSALSLTVCLAIGIKRFRERIERTHEARWQARRSNTGTRAR